MQLALFQPLTVCVCFIYFLKNIYRFSSHIRTFHEGNLRPLYSHAPCVFTGKIWVPKQKPMDPVLESVTLEPELEEALANASDAELCDIAGKPKGQTCLPEGFLCRESPLLHLNI